MGKKIGIDLGTTNSVTAVVDGPRPKILENKENRPQTRSVVSPKKRKGSTEPEILVGDVALDNWPFAPRDTIISIKRLMGRAISDAEVEKVRKNYLYEVAQPSAGTRDSVCVKMGGKEYTPIEISAMILRKLKSDAEFRLGEEVTHAVITVPAYFTQIQKDATRQAGLKAGMRVKILDEPTAAAIAFGMDAGESEDAKTIMVYDLGGGTFDISVMMISGGVFAQLNLEGDMWLGGDNFDQVVVDHVLAHIKKEYGVTPNTTEQKYLRFMVALRKAAQETKERLSSARSADLIVAGLLPNDDGDLIDVEVEITRDEYERMIRPLVERSVTLVKKALTNANLTADQIDFVLMAGNSTCVPLVQQTMEEMFGPEKVLRKIHPKHAVAMGAALMAVSLRTDAHPPCEAPSPDDPKRPCGFENQADATVCKRCGAPLQPIADAPAGAKQDGEPEITIGTIGTIAQTNYGTQSEGNKFNVFIKKGDPYPTPDDMRLPQTFSTRIAGQRMLSIPVFGGDDLAKANTNEKQGEAFAILPPSLPKDTRVHIKLWLNEDGIFDLTASLEDGTDLTPWIMKGASDQKAAEQIERVEKILAEKRQKMSPEERKNLDKARNRAFEELKKNNFDAALKAAEECEKMASDSGKGDEVEELKKKAENLISYTEFVLKEYSWALTAGQEHRLSTVAKETKNALAGGDMRLLGEKVKELDKATDELPDVVRLVMGMKGAIISRIKPVDPGLASEFIHEINELEKAFKAREPDAVSRLVAVADKLTAAIKKTEKDAAAGAAKCSVCGAELKGERKCPKCGDDSWIPRAVTRKGETSIFHRL